jgi:hypothetical protein
VASDIPDSPALKTGLSSPENAVLQPQSCRYKIKLYSMTLRLLGLPLCFVPALMLGGNLNFEPALEQTDALHVLGHCRSGGKMLTILAILAGPILMTTIVMIVVFEIRDAWDRYGLR